MTIKICIGSSCYLKGSKEIVERLQQEVTRRGLENAIRLEGSFCMGKCNRDGVTLDVDGTVYQGVTIAGFESFMKEHIFKD